MFQDNPSRVKLAHLIGTTVIVQEYGELKLDPYNPFAPPRPTGKRTRGVMEAHSPLEVKVGGVIFRPDHVTYCSALVDGDSRIETFHLHRGHRDDYDYGKPRVETPNPDCDCHTGGLFYICCGDLPAPEDE